MSLIRELPSRTGITTEMSFMLWLIVFILRGGVVQLGGVLAFIREGLLAFYMVKEVAWCELSLHC